MEKQIRFQFDAPICKAEERDGKYYVIAIASDDTEDQHGERVTEKALEYMARQATEKRIPLLENHKSTFELGYTSNGTIEKDSGVSRFLVEFELDDDFVESKKLFKAVTSGNANKQLSIGGFLDMTDKEASFYEKREDGTRRRALNKIELDHIALTRVSHAANKNTGFRHALVKALEQADEEAPSAEIGQTIKISETKSYPLNSNDVSWKFDDEDVMDILQRGGKNLMLDISLAKNVDNNFWLGVHHKLDSDGILKTSIAGVVNATEQLLKDQWNGSVYGLSDDQARQCAEHLISHYAEYGIEPPLGLYNISRGTLGNWTQEAENAWGTAKESIMCKFNSDKEKENMADETVVNSDNNESVKAETVEATPIAKALTDIRGVLAGAEVQDADNTALKDFLTELAGKFGLTPKVEDASASEDKNDPRESFLSGAESFVAATKSLETLSGEVKVLLKGLEDSTKAVIKEVVASAIEALNKDVTSKLEGLNKRLGDVEKLEGVSASEDSENESEEEVDCFKGMFDQALKVASYKMPLAK